jgi:hypothetical protein
MEHQKKKIFLKRCEGCVLGEQDFGLWYVNTEAQMLARYPDEVRRRDLMFYDGTVPEYRLCPIVSKMPLRLDLKHSK